MPETNPELARTPLYETHRSLDARMRPFAGFEMPVQYTGIMEEHLAVRNHAGLFDVSHMGEFLVTGPGAEALVQHVATNDADKLSPGRAMYTVMCNESGGIIDDLLVYKLGEERFMLVVNAANIGKDLAWLRRQNSMDARIEDLSEATALMALQGPRALTILEEATNLSLGDLEYYHFRSPTPEEFLGCTRAVVSATGYTGESGFELYCEAERAQTIWDAVMAAGRSRGLKPAGLGARDTLRIEAGYCLYGNDITESTNPLEAGLGWLVKLEKDSFIGHQALRAIDEAGPKRRLIGFVMEERGIPRHDYPIRAPDGNPIGTVTSGTQSPILDCGIGMGYVPNNPMFTDDGSSIQVEVRTRNLSACVKDFPLHRNS
jgi:aminomethyltransferase